MTVFDDITAQGFKATKINIELEPGSNSTPPSTLPPPTDPLYLSLWNRRRGYAASVTGGTGGQEHVVTNLDNSGPGSLREGLESANTLNIRFAVDGTINLTDVIRPKPNKTVTGFGRQITITGKEFRIDGNDYPGQDANIIMAYLNCDWLANDFNDDSISINNGANLVWITSCHFTDWKDGAIDVTQSKGAEMRVTMDWCRFGDSPGPQGFATHGPSATSVGKANLIGNASDKNNVGFIKTTFVNNLWKHCSKRMPKAVSTTCHVYNNAYVEWGAPAGQDSYCIGMKDDGSVWAENNMFRSYNNGDTHWYDQYAPGTVVTKADKEVYKALNSPVHLHRSGDLFLNNETGITGQGNPVAPDYSYAMMPATQALLNFIEAQAGNVQS